MNNLQIFTLKALRKIAQKCGFLHVQPPLQREMNPDKASEMIYNLLMGDKPCMVARFGAFELATIVNYLGVCRGKQSWIKYIRGEALQWWWNERLIKYLNTNAGFFPPTHENVERFCEMMLEDAREVDILGSWMTDENIILRNNTTIKMVHLMCLEPYWAKVPWSRALEGKHVLVVHPFVDDIVSQYTNNREFLFTDKCVLPQFASLRVVKAVQSLGGDSNGFNDWFEALEWMKAEMEKEPYDIALIGCGAYGFPLAAHSKRMGHKAIHLGGALQLLFGIKGKRWENADYGCRKWNIPVGVYSNLFNQNWVYPRLSNRPQNASKVENGCYW